MTRVEFIFNVEDKLAKTADLCEKAVAKGRQLTVAAADAALYSGLQDALWQGAPSSFLPLFPLQETPKGMARHCPVHFFLHNTPAAQSPLRQYDQLLQDDVLIHFLPETPTFFSRFRYLVELVGLTEEDKIAARARFKFYRDRGYEIKTTDMATNA